MLKMTDAAHLSRMPINIQAAHLVCTHKYFCYSGEYPCYIHYCTFTAIGACKKGFHQGVDIRIRAHFKKPGMVLIIVK